MIRTSSAIDKILANRVGRMICLLGLLACMLPFFSTAVYAAGSGRISGQLLDGTNNKAALAGQTVTLQMAQNNSSQDLTTAKTDGQGRFSFTNLSTERTINYAVYIRYQGAHYVTDLLNLSDKPEQQVNLVVYQSTASTANVAVVQSTVLVHEPDAQRGIITISEILAFRNLDTHAFVGSLDSSKGKPNALFFSLPHGARNIDLSRGFDGYQVIQVDRGFATDAALPPGSTVFAFAYEVPYNAATYDFSYVAKYPTVSLSVMVPPSIQANTGALTSEGVITADQHPYRLFKTTGLANDQEIHVGLGGLPNPANSASSALNPTSIWLIVGILLMLAVVAVTWFFYRSRRISAKKSAKMTKSTQATKHSAAKVSERREELLQELLDLDTAFEAGTLTKAVYQEKRAKTKAQLRNLISEREASRR